MKVWFSQIKMAKRACMTPISFQELSPRKLEESVPTKQIGNTRGIVKILEI